jgi:hypothetical protein
MLLILALYLTLTVVLGRKYLRTRDVGFVWLAMAVVFWPLISNLIGPTLIRRLIRGQPVKFYPFSLAQNGQMSIGQLITSLNSLEQLIGVALLLVAVLYLYKRKWESGEAVSSKLDIPSNI